MDDGTDYWASQRRDKWKGWLIGLGLTVLVLGAIGIYAWATMKPSATFGQPCSDEIECTGERAICFYDAPNHGVCTQTCTSRDDVCDHAGGCAFVDTVQNGQANGGKMFVCVGAP
jgi:hypothetical protein